MRHFIYFSKSARTSGNFDSENLMKAGRMDIVIHSVIAALYLSNSVREDVKVHLVFYGQPDPPKHIEIQANSEMDISKKDLGGLIKKVLYKYKEFERSQVFPGIFVEKKSLIKVVEGLSNSGSDVFILDKKGEDIRNIEFEKEKDVVFVLGDQDGLPKKEMKRLREISEKISLGPKTYFASQSVVIVNNELDRKGI
jgi:tRNA (pseudouridine54-N1)-methyltransferase